MQRRKVDILVWPRIFPAIVCGRLKPMQKVLTAAEMREVDRRTTEEYGIPSIILMENAAHAVARVITEKLGGSVKEKSILILCGKGNNGGDGAALARILMQHGAAIEVILLSEFDELSGDALLNFNLLRNLSGPYFGNPKRFVGAWLGTHEIGGLVLTVCSTESDWLNNKQFVEKFASSDLIVDAIVGTGATRKLEGLYERVAEFVCDLSKQIPTVPYILSVDIPSGLNADSGTPPGKSIVANRTVTFGASKPGNVLAPAAELNGDLIISDIGLPGDLVDEQSSQLFLSDKDDAIRWLENSEFSSNSYKSKRGHTLLIAGSQNYSGAAVLAGNAATRSGVGLVTVVTPVSSKDSVAARVLPEVMVRGVAETENGAVSFEAFDEISDLLEKADAVAVGCGLSRDESTQEFVKKIVENRRQPIIVDADALNLLSPFAGEAAKGESDAPLILTPHEGEFMRLLGTDDKDVIRDRVAAVREFAQKHNVILVLKGERVLIGEPGGKVVVNPTGNSGLGKAGNGDTLTGIIAGFAAQAAAIKIDMFETVVAAVYLAGLAGDIAEKKYGKRVMTASDVRECLTEAFAQVELEK